MVKVVKNMDKMIKKTFKKIIFFFKNSTKIVKSCQIIKNSSKWSKMVKSGQADKNAPYLPLI